MEFWIVRHGQTDSNVLRITQGQSEGSLTELGVLQAQRLGERLSSVRFDAAYISDLGRTRHTAAEILSFHSSLEATFDARLREKSAGVFEGAPYGSQQKQAKTLGVDNHYYRPEGGESWEDVAKRATSIFHEIAEKYCNNGKEQPCGVEVPSTVHSLPKVLLVSHGGFIKQFLNGPVAEYCTAAPFPSAIKNTGLSILRYDPTVSRKKGRIKLLRVNDVSHLKSS